MLKALTHLGKLTGIIDLSAGAKKCARGEVEEGCKNMLWGAFKMGFHISVAYHLYFLSRVNLSGSLSDAKYRITIHPETDPECTKELFNDQLTKCFNMALHFFKNPALQEENLKDAMFLTLKNSCSDLTEITKMCHKHNPTILNFATFIRTLGDTATNFRA